MRVFCTGFIGYGDDNCKPIFEVKVYDSGCQIEIPKDIEEVEEWIEISNAIKKCIAMTTIEMGDMK